MYTILLKFRDLPEYNIMNVSCSNENWQPIQFQATLFTEIKAKQCAPHYHFMMKMGRSGEKREKELRQLQ